MSDDLIDQIAGMAVFATVVQARSFSAAAQQLGQTKSAVSKQVARLERSLGVKLLHRTTRSQSLTEAGQALYLRAAQGVALAEEARAELAHLSASPRGTLRVTAPMTFGKFCVAPAVLAFLERYPEVKVQLTLLDRNVDLADEGFDLAIRLAQSLPDQVVARKLTDIRYLVCASPGYVQDNPPLRSPADLAAHNCLYFGYGGFGDTWVFDSLSGRESVQVAGNFTVNSSDVIRDALLAGSGVGVLPSFVVEAELRDGRLLQLLPEWRPQGEFGASAYAVWLPDRHLPPKLRVFIDFLLERWAQASEV